MLITRNAMAALAAAVLVTTATAAQEPVRSVVLLHGATMDASGWRAVHEILTEKGFAVEAVQLPLTSLEADVAAAERAVGRQRGPVVLVGHSYGGAVASVAGRAPQVRALVYVAALQPDAGESVADLAARWPMPSHPVDLGDATMIVDPLHYRHDVAADLDASDAAFLAASQRPTAMSVFTTKLPAVAWRDKPSHAVLAMRDRTLDPEMLRFMYARSKAEVVEVDTSHVPHIVRPDTVAEVIVRAAGDW